MNLEIIQIAFAAAVGLVAAAAAVTDFRGRRIPNAITVPAAVAGILFHTLLPGGWGFTVAASGCAVGFVLLLVPHFVGGGGMGDVKLLAALGAWLGPALVLVTFVTAIFAAAAMIVATTAFGAARRLFVATDHAPDVDALVSDGSGSDCSLDDDLARDVDAHDAARSARREHALPFALPVAFATWCVLAWFLLTRGF